MSPRGGEVLMLLLLAGPALAVAQRPAFSSLVEAVRVDALVTDKGHVVRGLQPADFEVLDNGVRQQVDLVSFEQLPLNVVLALDMSSSIVGERLEHLRDAARAVLSGLKAEDQVGLITFSHLVVLGSPLTRDIDAVRAMLNRSLLAGGTALLDGIYGGMMLGESDVGRALLIAFSDGFDTSSWLAPEVLLDTAKRSDVVVYTVAIGTSRKPAVLRDLSELSGGRLLQVESTRDLTAAFLGILDEFRNRYLVSYSPRGVSKEGWHRLDVRVARKNVVVKARSGYQAGSGGLDGAVAR